MLDYQFNETGFCACGDTGKEGACVPGVYPSADKGKIQYLVIGDSVSMGLFKTLEANLSATHQTVHAPGNNDNANWGSRCVDGWLGARLLLPPPISRFDCDFPVQRLFCLVSLRSALNRARAGPNSLGHYHDELRCVPACVPASLPGFL